MTNTRQLTIFCFVLIVCTVSKVICQSCAESGRWCPDDKFCCGGCCRSNVCLDMYGPCTVMDDLCLTYECPPGLECYVYTPYCEGCAPRPACKEQSKNWN